MRGHVRQRSKGTWLITIELGNDPVTGKRDRYYTTVHYPRKSDAERHMRQIMHEMETGTFIIEQDIRLGEYLNRWLKDYAEVQVAPRTYARYEEIIHNHILPALGRVPLQKLRPLHLQNFYSALLKGGRLDGKPGGLSAQTVQHYHRLLRNALQQAVRWQMLAVNPADAVTPPKVRRSPDLNILTGDEVKSLLEQVEKRAPQYYTMVLLAISTGMRRGELYGLRWIDVDLAAGVVSIKQVAQSITGQGVSFKEPKTKKSKRTIPIPKIVARALAAHKVEQAEKRIAHGPGYQDHGLVFCQPDGRPGFPDSVTSWFAKFIAASDLPKIRFHDLRHTHVALMIKLGVHIKTISERLGHSSIATTMDIYGHLIPGVQEAAVTKFEEEILQK